MSSQLRPVAKALEILRRLSVLDELQQVSDLGGKDIPDLGRRREEELSARVGEVHPPAGEVLVKFGLQGDGVLGEEQSVDVESEWNRGVTQLMDSVERLETTRQPDLDNELAEGTAVGDDVHISGSYVCGAVVVLCDGNVDLSQFLLERRVPGPGGAQRSEGIDQMGRALCPGVGARR